MDHFKISVKNNNKNQRNRIKPLKSNLRHFIHSKQIIRALFRLLESAPMIPYCFASEEDLWTPYQCFHPRWMLLTCCVGLNSGLTTSLQLEFSLGHGPSSPYSTKIGTSVLCTALLMGRAFTSFALFNPD